MNSFSCHYFVTDKQIAEDEKLAMALSNSSITTKDTLLTEAEQDLEKNRSEKMKPGTLRYFTINPFNYP